MWPRSSTPPNPPSVGSSGIASLHLPSFIKTQTLASARVASDTPWPRGIAFSAPGAGNMPTPAPSLSQNTSCPYQDRAPLQISAWFNNGHFRVKKAARECGAPRRVSWCPRSIAKVLAVFPYLYALSLFNFSTNMGHLQKCNPVLNQAQTSYTHTP